MERAADWMDQAQGDLAHAQSDVERGFYDWACFFAIPTRYPNAHPSGSPRRRYTRTEAERMAAHAEKIVQFCGDGSESG